MDAKTDTIMDAAVTERNSINLEIDTSYDESTDGEGAWLASTVGLLPTVTDRRKIVQNSMLHAHSSDSNICVNGGITSPQQNEQHSQLKSLVKDANIIPCASQVRNSYEYPSTSDCNFLSTPPPSARCGLIGVDIAKVCDGMGQQRSKVEEGYNTASSLLVSSITEAHAGKCIKMPNDVTGAGTESFARPLHNETKRRYRSLIYDYPLFDFTVNETKVVSPAQLLHVDGSHSDRSDRFSLLPCSDHSQSTIPALLDPTFNVHYNNNNDAHKNF